MLRESIVGMSCTSSRLFCPHLSFRQTNRHKRSSGRSGHLNEEDGGSSISVHSSGVVDDASSYQEYIHEGSGEPADLLPFPSYDNNNQHQGGGVVTSELLRKELICEDCDPNEFSSPRLPNHLWKCLEPKCRRMLCGKQGQNHSQYHFQVSNICL